MGDLETLFFLEIFQKFSRSKRTQRIFKSQIPETADKHRIILLMRQIRLLKVKHLENKFGDAYSIGKLGGDESNK